MSTDALPSTLVALETELFEPSVRGSRERLEALLHPAFFEIGRSGRMHTREEVLNDLLKEQTSLGARARDFAMQRLSEDVALLTYRSAQTWNTNTLERHAFRASIWKRSQNSWQIVFHQATPTEAETSGS